MAYTEHSKSSGAHRTFAHYIWIRVVLLWYFCHPGTCATFADSSEYLMNRYPNRDLLPQDIQGKALSGPENQKKYGAMKAAAPCGTAFLDAKALGRPTSFRGAAAPPAAATPPPARAPQQLAFAAPPAPVSGFSPRRAKSVAPLLRLTRAASCSRLPRCLGAAPCGGIPGGRPAQTMLLGGWGGSKPSGGAKPEPEGSLRAATVSFDSAPFATVPSNMDAAAPFPDARVAGGGGVLGSIVSGAVDVYDTAASFVGCALVTSPLGRRFLNPPQRRDTVTVTASAARGAVLRDAFDLVGFMDVDPLEASRRNVGHRRG